MKHLLNSCPFSKETWDWGANIFRISGRNISIIVETIHNWQQHPFQNEILNRIWKLFLGLILWNIWKERNRRIFKLESLPLSKVWTMINSNLLESVHLHPWSQEGLKCPPSEKLILQSWGFSLSNKSFHSKSPHPKDYIPDFWTLHRILF